MNSFTSNVHVCFRWPFSFFHPNSLKTLFIAHTKQRQSQLKHRFSAYRDTSMHSSVLSQSAVENFSSDTNNALTRQACRGCSRFRQLNNSLHFCRNVEHFWLSRRGYCVVSCIMKAGKVGRIPWTRTEEIIIQKLFWSEVGTLIMVPFTTNATTKARVIFNTFTFTYFTWE